MNWERKLEEKKRDTIRQRQEKDLERSEGVRRGPRPYVSAEERHRASQDLIQPIGKDRDKYLKRYGYLPDYHGRPGDKDHKELIKKDKKYL